MLVKVKGNIICHINPHFHYCLFVAHLRRGISVEEFLPLVGSTDVGLWNCRSKAGTVHSRYLAAILLRITHERYPISREDVMRVVIRECKVWPKFAYATAVVCAVSSYILVRDISRVYNIILVNTQKVSMTHGEKCIYCTFQAHF